jgi:hypothetical protein
LAEGGSGALASTGSAARLPPGHPRSKRPLVWFAGGNAGAPVEVLSLTAIRALTLNPKKITNGAVVISWRF